MSALQTDQALAARTSSSTRLTILANVTNPMALVTDRFTITGELMLFIATPTVPTYSIDGFSLGFYWLNIDAGNRARRQNIPFSMVIHAFGSVHHTSPRLGLHCRNSKGITL